MALLFRALLALLAGWLVASCAPANREFDFDGDGADDPDDCAPADPDRRPGIDDPWGDGIDQDCDGFDGIDRDGDGYSANADVDRDCDDSTALVHPGALDSTGDGLDADCDGTDGTDEDGDGFPSEASGGSDCDDSDPLVTPLDTDGDGHSPCDGDCDDTNSALNPLDADGDGISTCADPPDCDDTDPEVRPGAVEACDGVDTDCDGVAQGEHDADLDGDPACSDCDDDDPDRTTADSDGDGISSCDGDCLDTIAEANPLATDVVGDGVDQNCDGVDGIDTDGDGEPNVASGGADCDDDNFLITSATDEDGDGVALCDGDCDDDDPDVRPGFGELCDGLDTDCDGFALGEGDVDGDGALACADCDDDDPTVSPSATEACDGVDQDCDGIVDDGFDADGDGSTTCGGDCDDSDAALDALDVDLDGVTSCDGDCADTVAAVNPFATDLWGDGVDQNCDDIDGVDGDQDGEAGVGSGGADCDDDDPVVGSWTDDDGDGSPLCDGDCDDDDPARRPGLPEQCNGIDDDCDGFATGEGDGDGDGSLACEDCADADPARFPGQAELCNSIDDDCDGVVDDGFDGDLDGATTCAGDCDDDDPSVRPGFFEACDGVDTNCDGVVINEADYDGDGFPSCADCDDDDASRNPIAEEVCNSLDDDCDTLVDEEGDTDEDGDGLFAGGCGGDCDDGRAGPCEVVALAAGDIHICAILDTGGVHCWGRGSSGQLGYGNTDTVGDVEPAWSAGQVHVGAPVAAIDAGASFTCAILDGGSVRCWGSDGRGRLGYGEPVEAIGDDEAPAAAGDVDVGGDVVQIATGSAHTCAVLDGGALRCWGRGSLGQLGYGNAQDIGDDEAPAAAGDVDVGGTVVQVGAGNEHTCALLDTGAVRCWGSAEYGRLGYGDTLSFDVDEIQAIGDDETPSSVGDVPVGGDVVQIAVGNQHSCALLDTGAVRCWGNGWSGRLGYADSEHVGDDETPEDAGDVDIGGLAVEIAAGDNRTCALLEDGDVLCWGYGLSGGLGYGDTEHIGDDEAPASAGVVDVGGPTSSLAMESATCALLDTGAVNCWGQGSHGLLGRGSTQNIGDDETPADVGWVPLSLPLFP